MDLKSIGGAVSKNTICIFMILILGGCAFGHKYNYSVQPSVNYTGKATIALAVIDQRPYVKDFSKSPDFVGSMRSLFGIPYAVYTQSGKPLAEDISQGLTAALKQSGFVVSPLNLSPSFTKGETISELKSTRSDRLIYLVLNEWWSDSLHRSMLRTDVVLQVLDKEGKELAQSKLYEQIELGVVDVGAEIPRAYVQQFNKLINDPEIKAALSI